MRAALGALPHAPLALLKLFEKAAAMPAVSDAAHGDVAQLNAALARFAPICCFVDDADLAEVYRLAPP